MSSRLFELLDYTATNDQPTHPQLIEKLSCVVEDAVGAIELESATYVKTHGSRDLKREAFCDNSKALFALSLRFLSIDSDGRFSIRHP